MMREQGMTGGRRMSRCGPVLAALLVAGCAGGTTAVAGPASPAVARMERARLQAAAAPAGARIAPIRLPVQDEEKWIVHLLNRLGYGPRPGDVERARAMGLANYIALQLDPERIPDPAVEAKLQPLGTLTMSPQELLAAYPQPGAEERRARQGEMKRNERERGGADSGSGERPVRPRALLRMDPFGAGGEAGGRSGEPEGRQGRPEGRGTEMSSTCGVAGWAAARPAPASRPSTSAACATCSTAPAARPSTP